MRGAEGGGGGGALLETDWKLMRRVGDEGQDEG